LLPSFISSSRDINADKVIAAELAQVYHAVQHEHSYRSLDCGIKLNSSIYSDSEISKEVSCGHTKSEATVTEVLAPASVKETIATLTFSMIDGCDNVVPFYSLANDASNHGDKKLFPIAVRYWTHKNGVENKVLDFYDDPDETSAGITN
jgi:hypothetical protein